ncbi:heterodimeric geranylgeranyl pyrophosphate synthase small subunit, chloroplastic-like [Malania oleifera]|uniref:heterodimeric geranylgeranyl pyrophosphate synthase small subunit, chloroplastic-like n=1 Tax=Malania oleifera TaxID=397392 RepID=UPI0025ADE8CB|nr:heterodimeric geranylgeranyl pyrophosphate synthase small subunit, chloroplastic-like [Malania oleifera]
MAGVFLLRIDAQPNINLLAGTPRSNLHRPSRFKPCRMVAMPHHDHSYWASLNEEIEAHLQQAIPVRSPTVVFEPMRHLVFAAPRSMAPALCIAACEAVGGRREDAVAAASALHLVHAASFTHEHLSLTDRPKPRPMIRHAYDPNIELLTGDGIAPFGYELLARLDNPSRCSSDQILRVIIEISRAAGSRGVVNGRYREMQLDDSSSSRDDEWIDEVCKKKEGEIYACGGACGAIVGGGSEEEIEKLRRYGLYVGMIRGILNRNRRKEERIIEVVVGLRDLALQELTGFNGNNVAAISSLVGPKFCDV